MFQFDEDTRVDPVGAGRWRVHFTPRWNIGANPNGGYILATIVRALTAEVDKPDPLSVTAHYLRPTSVGDGEVGIEVVRSGRSHTHVEARLVQDTERVRVLAVFGDLDRADGPTLVRGQPPELPPPDECVGREPQQPIEGEAPSMMGRFESRFGPSAAAWMRGEASTEATITGWIRFADGRQPDVASLPLFADAFPPAVFALATPRRWVPTVELTVHVRARPAPGWLRARFDTRFLVDGYLEEDGELWDSEDRLVAQSRQLAMLLR